jgi:two-component system phosphate regulon response regulator PhoB
MQFGIINGGRVKALIYIVEDDNDVAGLIKFNLQASGFVTACFVRGDEAFRQAMSNPPALFLLDVMVPGMDGITLCKRIRESEQLKRIPVIFVSAKMSEDEKLEGFDAGADDYVTKPFSPRELVVRVEAVLRRYTDLAGPVIRFDGIEIDTAAMILTVNGRQVPTTALEFRLLEFLVRSPGLVFSRDRMLEAVWGGSASENRRSVDVYIRKLREKIEPDPENPQYLLTARGSGYMFVMPSFRVA